MKDAYKELKSPVQPEVRADCASRFGSDGPPEEGTILCAHFAAL